MLDKYSESLRGALVKLKKRYPMLKVYEGTTTANINVGIKSFLHIWKPVSSQCPGQGLTFLPTFSVVITAETNEEGLDLFLISLVTFHGKVVKRHRVSMEADVLDDTKLEVLDDLATDSIHVCQGVQEVQDRRWQQYVSKAKLPLLQKVMNVFFIEPSTISSPYASDEVVLRSRQCKYYVKNPVRNQDPAAVDYVRCDQCSVFQKKRPVTLFTYRKTCEGENSGQTNQTFDPNDEEDNLEDSLDYRDNEYASVANDVYSNSSQQLRELKEFRDFSKHIVQMKDEDMVIQPDLLPYQDLKSEILHSEDIIGGGSLDGDDDDTKDGDFMPSKAPAKKAPKRPRQPKTDKTASKKVKKEPKEPKVPKTKKSKNLSPAGGGGHASKPIWPKRVTVQEMQFVRSFVDLGEGFKEFGPDENEGVYVIEKNVKYQFKCMICMKRHDTYERATKCILRHSQVLNLNIPVKCPLCQSEVENKSLLNLHIELHHSDLQKSCCPECFDFFDYDHFSFYSARDQDNDMRKHFLKVHHSAVDKPNLCQTCGKGFENEMVLREHTKSVHEKDPQIICSSCGETFFNRKSHRRHMLLRHAQRNLRCLHCDKNLPDEVGKLGLHISIHTGIKPFKCAHCSYATERRGNVFIHCRKAHHKDVDFKADIVIDEKLKKEMDRICKTEIKLIRDNAAKNPEPLTVPKEEAVETSNTSNP